MKRNVFLFAVAAVVLASVPASAAPPFGSFGGILGGGNSGGGVIPLTGWALDDNGVQAVDVLVDGVVAGRANYSRARAGVTARFPGLPDSALPGFAYQLDSTRYLNGLHTVSIRVRSRAGEVVTLEPRTFNFTNVEHDLEPFGAIDFPRAQAEMRGTCDLSSPNRRYSVIAGYALDAGTQVDDAGVAYVELLIDRAVVANTRVDCGFFAETGGQTNCYGLRRLDVERTFPGLKDSPHAGFRFVLDIGLGIATGQTTQGQHLITIRAGDVANQSRNIAEMPVTFSCYEDLVNEDSFGEIDLTLRGLLYHGTIQVTGWALDYEGVVSVQILIDGHPTGNALYGLVRPADDPTLSFYPGFINSFAPGWRFDVDTTLLQNGEHFLDVIVTDAHGKTTFIGKRRFVVNNVGG
jgi:N-acetylmuramoyl-L-alanine amidase